jgi:cysteine desulfurase
MKLSSNKRIYLDFASATPVDKKVLMLMSLYEKDFFANATSIHNSGVKVREIIEKSRGKIAKEINAHSDEIIFTSSGTESDALAILGVIKNYELRIKNEKLEYKIPHIITTEIEHSAVLENCKILEERGEAEVTYIGVDKDGIINLEELKNSLKKNTVLVSVMYANNEIGTIQPIQEIAKIIRHFKKRKNEEYKFLGHGYFSAEKFLVLGSTASQAPKNLYSSSFPLFHIDACQAMNYLYTENIEKLGVDLMSFNSSKIYGPKGIGVLYKKRGIELAPLYSGGGQEFGLHSGTESVTLIAGLALAFEITNKIKRKESERLTKIRNYGIKKLLSLSNSSGYKIFLNGSKEVRLPNNINISISNISSELLVIELDAKGIEVSSRSACKSGGDDDSYVIKALRIASGEKINEEEGSLRITLGRQTTKADLDKFLSVLTKILNKYSKWKK